MRISVDLRHDEIVDLNKALSLISQAIAERSGQAPTVQVSAPQVVQQQNTQQQTPTIDQLRQNQQQSNQSQQSQPSSTGLFAPRQAPAQAAPPNRWDVNATPRNAPAEKKDSATESFGMLNMLGRKR